MRRQLVPGPVVRLTVIKAKTRPGIEASLCIVTLTHQIEGYDVPDSLPEVPSKCGDFSINTSNYKS